MHDNDAETQEGTDAMNAELPTPQSTVDGFGPRTGGEKTDALLYSGIGTVVTVGMWLSGDAIFAGVLGALTLALAVLFVVAAARPHV